MSNNRLPGTINVKTSNQQRKCEGGKTEAIVFAKRLILYVDGRVQEKVYCSKDYIFKA